MTIRTYSAGIILALWSSALALSAAPPARSASRTGAADLKGLVRSYRDSLAPAARAAVEAYAATHPRELDGALARLALGVIAYQQKDYATAATELRGLAEKLPAIADYPAYYFAAASVEQNDLADVAKELDRVERASPPSPYAGRAWLLEARALKSAQPAEAVRLLRLHYPELPQPEGDVALADCYQAAGELAHAADFYQRVYYRYISGDASSQAASALAILKQTMGAVYPQPLPQQKLQRADRLLEAREYRDARSEYQNLLGDLTGLERDQARVRAGASDLLAGNTAAAYPYLRGLDLPEGEADAERLYWLEECARRLTDEDEIMAALRRLNQLYPKSSWRLKALWGAANHYFAVNRPDDYVPLYKAVYEDFPAVPEAAASHWRVAFEAYRAGKSDAADLLRDHVLRYPSSANAAGALYFLGRSAEAENSFPTAARLYQRLADAFPNTYYGMLARQRLAERKIETIADERQPEILASLALPDSQPVPAEATRATTVRIERSRLLRAAGLGDLAEAELRFGARTDGQPALLAMEMATSADAPYLGLRAMKSLTSGYLNLPLAGAPAKYWQLLFPLPYREDLFAVARSRNLDPFLVAGLIRQESEFNPQALSRANAYGLTQVRPATGRLYARRAGVPTFSNRLLFQPLVNLKIGTTVLESMIEDNSGHLEQALASYNAGPNRVAEWLAWRTYREPAEFIESIPFTETREYVQAVLRNADVYRRLYGQTGSGAQPGIRAAIRQP